MPNEPSTKVRVVLISEVPIYRDGLRLLLDPQSGFTVVGAAASCGQAVEMTGAARPDVLVLDLGTPILPNLYARTDQLRYKDLFARGLVSRKQFEDSEEEVVLRAKELDVMQAELQLVSAETFAALQQDLAVTEKQADEAASRLKLLFAGSRPETIEATVAEIEQLETGRRYLADQLSLTAIVSPASGIVATPKLKDRVGEHLNKGDLVAKVYELDRITPEVLISEKEIADVKLGQRVVLKARAYPDERFEGRVEAIAPAAIEDGGLKRKVFRVRIQMDRTSDLLKPEMTGNAKIYGGRRSVVHLLTRRIARYLRVEFWSWW